tara:strand:- start:239 stop:802 length:564 start_codon:yes stop_codon:yes gene_type:complete
MRLDHIALRVKDRHKTVEFIKESLGYSVGIEFPIVFDDNTHADCFALVPPERVKGSGFTTKEYKGTYKWSVGGPAGEYHTAPEIFVSDGDENSIVGEWVKERNGIGGVHHLAYQVENIHQLHKEWKERGVEFLSEEVIDCPEDNLRQIFTKPIPEFGGIIIELIERGEKGFCQSSVKNLMNSTKGQK